MDRASEEYTQAKHNFWHISADIPSGFPHPDGKQRIENAARAQTAAMIAYTRALKRFNEFLINGAVPADVPKENVPKPAAPDTPQDSKHPCA